MATQQELEKYLHCITETTDNGDLPGWYFNDEAGYLHGPFETRNETLDNLQVYYEQLSNPPVKRGPTSQDETPDAYTDYA